MSPENKRTDNNDENDKQFISVDKRQYQQIAKYATEHDMTVDEAAAYLLTKGTPILEGIYKKIEGRATERKYNNLQKKRQKKRKE